ncbi:hypothetical protein K474DRAFT_712714 [Panus rudis PR-1116 ss-1]|nr:hypothetical protein K474DRAFT_712714 [Panus rudis PR-1116 ss-1]
MSELSASTSSKRSYDQLALEPVADAPDASENNRCKRARSSSTTPSDDSFASAASGPVEPSAGPSSSASGVPSLYSSASSSTQQMDVDGEAFAAQIETLAAPPHSARTTADDEQPGEDSADRLTQDTQDRLAQAMQRTAAFDSHIAALRDPSPPPVPAFSRPPSRPPPRSPPAPPAYAPYSPVSSPVRHVEHDLLFGSRSSERSGSPSAGNAANTSSDAMNIEQSIDPDASLFSRSRASPFLYGDDFRPLSFSYPTSREPDPDHRRQRDELPFPLSQTSHTYSNSFSFDEPSPSSARATSPTLRFPSPVGDWDPAFPVFPERDRASEQPGAFSLAPRWRRVSHSRPISPPPGRGLFGNGRSSRQGNRDNERSMYSLGMGGPSSSTRNNNGEESQSRATSATYVGNPSNSAATDPELRPRLISLSSRPSAQHTHSHPHHMHRVSSTVPIPRPEIPEIPRPPSPRTLHFRNILHAYRLLLESAQNCDRVTRELVPASSGSAPPMASFLEAIQRGMDSEPLTRAMRRMLESSDLERTTMDDMLRELASNAGSIASTSSSTNNNNNNNNNDNDNNGNNSAGSNAGPSNSTRRGALSVQDPEEPSPSRDPPSEGESSWRDSLSPVIIDLTLDNSIMEDPTHPFPPLPSSHSHPRAPSPSAHHHRLGVSLSGSHPEPISLSSLPLPSHPPPSPPPPQSIRSRERPNDLLEDFLMANVDMPHPRPPSAMAPFLPSTFTSSSRGQDGYGTSAESEY